MPAKPISDQRSTKTGPGCLVAFFLVFFLAGAAASWFILVRPMKRLIAARSWAETPCTVVSSQVAEVAGDDGSTYKVAITYTYDFGDHRYTSDRVRFIDFSSSGRKGKEEVVARYPPGSQTVCYVNPGNPSEAVLFRGFSAAYLFGLLPLVFLLIGGGGMIWAVRSMRSRADLPNAAPAPGAAWGITTSEAASGGPVEIKPTVSPAGQFGILLVATVIWNGITWLGLWAVTEGFERFGETWVMILLAVFALIGALIAFGAMQRFLMLFNPRPVLTLSRGALEPGEPASLQWRFRGRAGRVRRLKAVLEGREEACYRRGTSSYTDRSTFATVPVADVTDPYSLPAGTASFRVPAGTMPTFKADNNKIVWSLKVTCEIAGWPDSEDEYEIVVRSGGGF